MAEDRTCACEIATLPTSNAAGVTAGSEPAASSPPAVSDNEVEEMDTAEKALSKLGREAILTKFGNSCKLANLVAMVAEGFSEPMLSNRLQGAEVKEGLVITIY